MSLVLDTPPKLTLTAEEWDAIPDAKGLELVDGMVRFKPDATAGHEHVKIELRDRLHQLRPAGVRIGTELEIKLAPETRRKPDVLAYSADPADVMVPPGKVLLPVEMVSPGSQTTDRMHKPADYALARIPHYWRIELEPHVEVHTFRLGDTGWIKTGVWAIGDTIAAPGLAWAKIAVDSLVEGL